MENAEIKVVVEYLIKIPADIMVIKVDDYVKDQLDDGADSTTIVSRRITDVAFAERPGIIERMNEALEVLNRVEALTNPENQDKTDPMTLEDIHPFVEEFLDEVDAENGELEE